MATENDMRWMNEAILQARLAAGLGEVPIGAIAVQEGVQIAAAHNLRETTRDPLGHAEMLLLEKLRQTQESWRLEGVTVYVTCEPCVMCMGALLHARVKKVVFGCKEPKMGACGSVYDFMEGKLPVKCEVIGGVLEADCAQMMRDFFKKVRRQ